MQSCKVSEYLSLCGTAELSSRMTGPFTHQQYMSAPISLHLCQNSILSIFNFSPYGRCEVASLCALICIFLMTNNVDHLFFLYFLNYESIY